MEDPGRVLRSALSTCKRILVTGPTGPDGDSIGASLALASLLREGGAEVVVGGRPPRRYTFLPQTQEMVPDEALSGTFDAVVIVDGDRHRLEPNAARAFVATPLKGIVDHHVSSTPEGYTHAWIEPHTESTCGMLLRAFHRWEVPVDRPLAELLFTGIVFDTGAFRHPNTSPELLRLCADLLATGLDHATLVTKVLAERTPAGVHVMGSVLSNATFGHYGPIQVCIGRVTNAQMNTLVEGDLEGVVDALVNSEGTDLAVLLVERGGSVKMSLRSRVFDVAALARALHPTGGGHPRAAGASFNGPLAAAERHLVDTLTEVISA